MHHRGKLGGHPHFHLFEDQRPVGEAPEPDVLTVRHAETAGVLRRHVDMALGHDQAPLQADHPLPMAHGEARSTLDIPGETHRGRDPQGHRVGQGDLRLTLAPFRPEYHHTLQFSLGALQGQALGAGVLPRLREILDPVELIARAEQGLQIAP